MARRSWVFFIYLIVALFIANIGFNIVKFPDFFSLYINKWALLAAGIFLIIESFKYLRHGYGSYYSP